jgi:hypothetical protein
VASDNHKGDTKTAMKSEIMRWFKDMYCKCLHYKSQLALIGWCIGELTKQETFRLNWEVWSQGLPDQHNIVIVGWPLLIPPTALSNIHTVNEMNKLLTAVLNKTCYFDKASSALGGREGDNIDKCKSFSTIPHVLF